MWQEVAGRLTEPKARHTTASESNLKVLPEELVNILVNHVLVEVEPVTPGRSLEEAHG